MISLRAYEGWANNTGYSVVIKSMEDYKIDNLDSLYNILPKLKEYSYIKYKTYVPYISSYNRELTNINQILIKSITYPDFNRSIRYFMFDNNTSQWIVK